MIRFYHCGCGLKPMQAFVKLAAEMASSGSERRKIVEIARICSKVHMNQQKLCRNCSVCMVIQLYPTDLVKWSLFVIMDV